MRRYLVLNAKGGCGKSTLATNIAAYFASQWENVHVTLADYDPQQSDPTLRRCCLGDIGILPVQLFGCHWHLASAEPSTQPTTSI